MASMNLMPPLKSLVQDNKMMTITLKEPFLIAQTNFLEKVCNICRNNY